MAQNHFVRSTLSQTLSTWTNRGFLDKLWLQTHEALIRTTSNAWHKGPFQFAKTRPAATA